MDMDWLLAVFYGVFFVLMIVLTILLIFSEKETLFGNKNRSDVMRKWIIRTFGLKGSWKWAKKQMMNGKVVRCKHWSGALKLRIESPANPLLLSIYTRKPKLLLKNNRLWEVHHHHISYEDFTDYEIFECEL